MTSSAAVSSTYIGAPFSSSAAIERFEISICFSFFAQRPRLSRHMSTCARPAIILRVSASIGISSEKIITGWRLPSSDLTGTLFMSIPRAQLSAMFIASDVLPTDGRAAITIISEFLSP